MNQPLGKTYKRRKAAFREFCGVFYGRNRWSHLPRLLLIRKCDCWVRGVRGRAKFPRAPQKIFARPLWTSAATRCVRMSKQCVHSIKCAFLAIFTVKCCFVSFRLIDWRNSSYKMFTANQGGLFFGREFHAKFRHDGKKKQLDGKSSRDSFFHALTVCPHRLPWKIAIGGDGGCTQKCAATPPPPPQPLECWAP